MMGDLLLKGNDPNLKDKQINILDKFKAGMLGGDPN